MESLCLITMNKYSYYWSVILFYKTNNDMKPIISHLFDHLFMHALFCFHQLNRKNIQLFINLITIPDISIIYFLVADNNIFNAFL